MSEETEFTEVRKNVCVVVLGDIGRSPRMQYHALSFAKSNYNVDIIGYDGSSPLDALVEHPHIKIHHLKQFPNIRASKMLVYFLKSLWITFSLFMTLFFKRRSHIVICQNPPAIPTLFTCWFYCLVMKAQFIIDWHNYAHSIMGLSLGKKHVLVKLATWIESVFGRMADTHLCVTKALKKDLESRWGIRASTLYDRPPEIFQPISIQEKHDLFLRLAKQYPAFDSDDSIANTTVFTELDKMDTPILKTERPALIVSSTSWTEDEDFSILLSALQEYEQHCETNKLKNLICAITGKGPLKEYYIQKIESNQWNHVKVVTPWLEPNDYPLLLASADLGVCLHTSSSGLDLPMKVVDMFGCGLPVCAINFECLNELVIHGENGYVFKDSSELKDLLITWFADNNKMQEIVVNKFKENLKEFQKLRWDENWNLVTLPLLANKYNKSKENLLKVNKKD